MRLGSALIASICLLYSLNARGRASETDQVTYDIRQYDLFIEPDFAARRLHISAVVTIANPGLAKSFEFGLNDSYESVRVTANGQPAKVQRGEGSVTVDVERPSRRTVISFDLQGAPGKSQGDDREVIDGSSLYLLWSDRFYPIAFDDWATVRTRIVLPAAFSVVAPGRETGTEPRGGAMLHTFESRRPALAFSVIADSRWIRTKRTINGIHMQTLLHPQSNRYAGKIFAGSAEVLKFYVDTLGPYNFDGFSFITIPEIYARRAFPGWVGYSPPYLEKEMKRTGYDAHETALLWWTYTATGSGAGSWQWSEGLGDYAEVLYGEKFHKPLPANLEYFRAEYLKLPPEKDLAWDQLQGNSPQEIVHGKYPWLMHVLRYRMGDAAFQRGLKELFSRYRFRTFTMDQFIAALEKASGQSLAWWRDEWLGRKGVPEIAVQWGAEPSAGGYRVNCELVQTRNVYHLPLEIGIRTAGKTQVQRTNLTQARQTAVFELRDKPDDVVVDPHHWLLLRPASIGAENITRQTSAQ